MGLATYRAKRKPTETTEPKPHLRKSSGGVLVFVVQKHNASHLHYDLRLELDGVLKSWAVPKGPPRNSTEKRLAVMVEDHPYAYKDFEGVIPEGNYGAGTVEIWDSGDYVMPDASSKSEAEKQMREGLKKGHVRFVLRGKRLKGEFSLVHMHRPGSENAWLFLKKGNVDPPKTQTSSSKTKREKMPNVISPMLAQLVDKPFNKKGWLFEIKWDGYRAIARIQNSKVQFISRNEKSFNSKFPLVVTELKKHLKHDAILDGEIVVLDSQGRSQFQLMQNYQREHERNLFYYVFDLLYLDGKDLRELPLIERKEMLELILAPLKDTRIRYSDHVEEKGIRFFKEAKKRGLEGIIAKNAESTYQTKRSRDWQKIKTHFRQEVVIGGFTQPRGSRKKFGALLVGLYEGKQLQFAGHVGSGFSEETLSHMFEQLMPLVQKKSPFISHPTPNAPVTYVKPKLVCEVSFAEWTAEGYMRQPIFEGLRVDKKAKDVSKENATKI